MSMADRLAAFQLRTRGINAKAAGLGGKYKVQPKSTDIDYMGGKMRFAPPDVVAVYEKVR